VRIGRCLIKWTLLASLVGVLAGSASALFLISLDWATATGRERPGWCTCCREAGFSSACSITTKDRRKAAQGGEPRAITVAQLPSPVGGNRRSTSDAGDETTAREKLPRQTRNVNNGMSKNENSTLLANLGSSPRLRKHPSPQEEREPSRSARRLFHWDETE
jgi:hypothetical protein